MVHRLIVIGIVGFWLAMTALLVVRELYPEMTQLNAVPVTYVAQLFFQHEQSSELQIYSAAQPVGSLHIRPRTDAVTGMRAVDVNGNVSLTLPGARQQKFWWNAVFELSRSLSVDRIQLSLSSGERSSNMVIQVDLIGRKASFGARMGKEILSETEITLDQHGLDILLAKAGVEPVLLQQIKASRSEMPEFSLRANASSMALAGQKLSTVLLTLKAGDQILFDAHVSQLGQVLRAQAPLFGLRLMPPNLPQ